MHELEGALARYNLQLAQLQENEGEQLAVLRESDQEVVTAILKAHQSLTPQQRLVLTVDTQGLDDDVIDGLPTKYQRHLASAHLVFKEHLFIAALSDDVRPDTLERITNIKYLPPYLDLVAPPNVSPTEDLGANTSASRAAYFSGEVKTFLDIENLRTYYLAVIPTGLPFSKRLSLHPSMIKSARLEQVGQAGPDVVRFRAVDSI